jgi:hypothetical protein
MGRANEVHLDIIKGASIGIRNSERRIDVPSRAPADNGKTPLP